MNKEKFHAIENKKSIRTNSKGQGNKMKAISLLL